MKQRILAIDDEPHMLKLLERIITEKTPYSVTSTSNPLEVPKILEQEEFDVIITDLKMPGMDGLDILNLVREQNRFEQVVIITAFGSLDSAVEALSKGVFDYITKPFKKEQIIFTIDRAMRWQQIKREATRLSRLFELEPYEQAQQALQQEYVRRLADRCQRNEATMSQRSGLSLDQITRLLPEATKGEL
jgi:DNA-binding NtrC family response regulator